MTDPISTPDRGAEDVPEFDHDRAEAAVRELLAAIGEDPDREGLRDTPARVARAYAELTAGLRMTAADVLTTTFDLGHDEMVLVRDIELWSMCEHHLVPFTGVAHVGYIPAESGKITGLSKLARLVEVVTHSALLAERLAAYPLLLDELLDTRVGGPLPGRAEMLEACLGVAGGADENEDEDVARGETHGGVVSGGEGGWKGAIAPSPRREEGGGEGVLTPGSLSAAGPPSLPSPAAPRYNGRPVDIFWKILATLGLVALNGYFFAAEFADVDGHVLSMYQSEDVPRSRAAR